MSLNWREIDAILEELPLLNSHIQKIRQPDYGRLIFDIYHPERRFSLLICLAPGQTRLHALYRKVSNPPTLQRFAQFLRARIQSGRIVAVGQLGRERIVKIVVSKAGLTTRLWIRLWSGAANIIATDESGIILDAFYRRPKREEISGASFDPEKELSVTADADVYVLRDLPAAESFNQAIAEHYDDRESARRAGEIRSAGMRRIEAELDSLTAGLARVRKRKASFAASEQSRQIGDLLMANLHSIEKGAKWVELEDFHREGEILRIELDPARSARENAESHYRKYGKSKAGLENAESEEARILARITSCEIRASALEDTNDKDLLIAHEDGSLDQDSSRGSGKGRGRASATKTSKERGAGARPPGAQFRSKDFTILVGRSAKENDELLRAWVRGNDYWLHVRDFPGAYVFVKSLPGKTVPLEVLLDAGNLAVHYSKAKTGGQADLYYTQVKHLRRPKGGRLGLVIPTQEKNLAVKIEPDRISRLIEK